MRYLQEATSLFLFTIFLSNLAATNGQNLSLVSSCETNCSADFITSYRNLFGSAIIKQLSAPLGSVPDFRILLDTTTQSESMNSSTVAFRSLCRLYSAYQTCLNACSSFAKLVLEQSLSPVRYLCVDKQQEYLEHLPCTVVVEKVIRSNCSRQLTNMANATRTLQNAVNQPMNMRPRILEALCQQTSLYIDCYTGVYEPLCGPSATNLSSDLLRLTLSKLYDIAARSDFMAPVPGNCKALLNQGPSILSNLDNGDWSRFLGNDTIWGNGTMPMLFNVSEMENTNTTTHSPLQIEDRALNVTMTPVPVITPTHDDSVGAAYRYSSGLLLWLMSALVVAGTL